MSEETAFTKSCLALKGRQTPAQGVALPLMRQTPQALKGRKSAPCGAFGRADFSAKRITHSNSENTKTDN